MDLTKLFPIDVSTGGAALIWSFGGYEPSTGTGKAQIIAGENFEQLRSVTNIFEKSGRHARYRLYDGMMIVQANTNRNQESFSIYKIVQIDTRDRVAAGQLIVQDEKYINNNGEIENCPEEITDKIAEAVAAAIGTANTAYCQEDYYSRRYV